MIMITYMYLACVWPKDLISNHIHLLCLIMAVSLGTAHYIKVEETGKKWVIADELLKEPEGEGDVQWLQLRATTYGLCNLLVHDKLSARQPSLRQSEGYQKLLEKRTKVAEHALKQPSVFDDEGTTKGVGSKKRKRNKQVEKPKEIEVDLGGHGKLTMKFPQKATEDLCIPFAEKEIATFCAFMLAEGADSISGAKRAYSRTGKYAKKQDDDCGDEVDEE